MTFDLCVENGQPFLPQAIEAILTRPEILARPGSAHVPASRP